MSVVKYPKDFMDVLLCPGIERTPDNLICRYCARNCEEVDYDKCFEYRIKYERK